MAWKTPIPGLAHSSPIVWGDRVYVTTGGRRSGRARDQDWRRRQVGSIGHRHRPHTWRLIALDRQTGKIVWDRAAHQGVPRMKRHVKASHASATPATDGRYIVALMGSEGLFCFDMNGTLKWRADLGVMDVGLVDDPELSVGTGQLAGDLRRSRHRPERSAQGRVPRGLRPRHRQGAVAHGPR